jgi:GntR family transcriptional repressor for pyruvate dehydrogenase complex
MENGSLLNQIQEVTLETPTDVIIDHIKRLLNSGELKPGNRLPSERKLAEQFNVGRAYVREAFQKLELYGILKTLPQSGTYIAGLEISALEGLISEVMKLDDYDFFSLAETRLILEINAARLCAMRRTEADLEKLDSALQAYLKKAEEGPSAVEEDLMLHRTIADGSHNKVIKSLMLIITPDLMRDYHAFRICQTIENVAVKEHILLVEAIKRQDADAAVNIMRTHLKGIMAYALSTTDRLTGEVETL